MLANTTIVPNKAHSMSIADIAKTLQTQPKENFLCSVLTAIKIPLPAPLTKLLLIAAQALKSENAVTLLVRNSWLTTQEAADIMGYSRQVVVDLIKKSKLKASQLGSHRRIRLTDLMEFIESGGREGSEAVAKIVSHTKEVIGHGNAAA